MKYNLFNVKNETKLVVNLMYNNLMAYLGMHVNYLNKICKIIDRSH